MLYKLIKCIQWTLLNIDVNILYPLKKLKSKFLFNANFKLKKLQLKQGLKLFLNI
jgi:hypothetical protein